MDALSECEAALTLAHGLNPQTIGIIRLDNVQNYLFQRDTSVGRQNKLNIGLAPTYYEIELDGVANTTALLCHVVHILWINYDHCLKVWYVNAHRELVCGNSNF